MKVASSKEEIIDVDPSESKLIKSLNNINKVFEQADLITSDDILTQLTNSVDSVTNLPAIIDTESIDYTQVISLKELMEDFRSIRSTLSDTVETGKKIMDEISVAISNTGLDEIQPEMIGAFSSLLGTVNTSMKLLITSYKEISTIILNLNKIQSAQTPQTGSKGNTTNNLNIYTVNTADIIKDLVGS